MTTTATGDTAATPPPAPAPALGYGARPAGPRLTRRQVRRIFLALAASPFLLFVLFDVGCGLERRSVLWPWIDTVGAPGYSESSFAKVKAGMTRAEVDRAMGCAPLSVWHADAPLAPRPPDGTDLDRGVVVYTYTHDGRCPWGDFAWFSRDVLFRDGVVAEVRSRVYYD